MSDGNKGNELPAWMQESDKKSPPKSSSVGRYFAYGFGGALAIGSYVLASFVIKPINRGKGRGVILPYVPATDVQVANILRALNFKTGLGYWVYFWHVLGGELMSWHKCKSYR